MITTRQLGLIAESLATVDGHGADFTLDSRDPGNVHGYYVLYFSKARRLIEELERHDLHIEVPSPKLVRPF